MGAVDRGFGVCMAIVDMAAVRLSGFVAFLDFEIGMGAVFVGVIAFIVAV